jgi:transcriptional regulator with XRE-family HTH domain
LIAQFSIVAAVESPRKDRVPNVGQILKQLRARRGESLRDVARGTGLSASFLSMVERNESDITLGNLDEIAAYFGHDIGSLLGYSARGARVQIVAKKDRVRVDRGDDIDYEVLHIPGTDMEIILAKLAPDSAFKDELTHDGIDIALVLQGRIIVTVNDVDYPVEKDEAAVWSGSYRHRIRNDADRPAHMVAFVTEQIY